MSRFDDIRKWGMDRNIIQGTRPEKQFIKLMEEVGELALGMKDADVERVKDGIGDSVVVLVMLSAQSGLNLAECWQEAIRTGAKHAGLFNRSRHEQFESLIVQIGVLAEGLAKGKPEKVMQGLGDCMVVLTTLALDTNTSILDCIEIAWNEIKDRKGKMVDGIFVKEADLKPCHNPHCECEAGGCTHPGYRDARGEAA